MASLLLENGADVNALAAKFEGRTALEGAAEHGHIDMLMLLLNAGANIKGPGESQRASALQLAKDNGHRFIVEILEASVQGNNE